MTEMLAFATSHWLLIACLSVLLLLGMVALYDIRQRKHAVLHNFPVLGHFRYLVEKIGPGLRQYIVTDDTAELPFNRSERSWVYASSKGQNNHFGFGTAEQIYSSGYPIVKNAVFPIADHQIEIPPGGDATSIPCLKVMGEYHKRLRPYRPPSIVNISALSYGALGKNAISALNLGAEKAGCFHNTGEGGISDFHRLGADIVWQLGTGYFGARDEQGKFSFDVVRNRVAKLSSLRAIEIKLSQGAKPGKGGILPGVKVTPAIAAARDVPVGRDCISPTHHSQFHDIDTMIDFIEKLAEVSGLPVGIKAAIGEIDSWRVLAQRMRERNQSPDFITIDGGEGGTGSAPLTFADHVSLPFKIGFARVYKIFQETGVSERIVWIGGGKLGFPDRAVVAFALGCDMINIAREAMMSIGCIQSRKCHTGRCPTGVTTHREWLQAGLDIELKSTRCAQYIITLRNELLDLTHAAGYHHPAQFSGGDVEFSSGINQFSTLDELIGYRRDSAHFSSMRDLGCSS